MCCVVSQETRDQSKSSFNNKLILLKQSPINLHDPLWGGTSVTYSLSTALLKVLPLLESTWDQASSLRTFRGHAQAVFRSRHIGLRIPRCFFSSSYTVSPSGLSEPKSVCARMWVLNGRGLWPSTVPLPVLCWECFFLAGCFRFRH